MKRAAGILLVFAIGWFISSGMMASAAQGMMDGVLTGVATVTKDEGGQAGTSIPLNFVCRQDGVDVTCVATRSQATWKGTYTDKQLVLSVEYKGGQNNLVGRVVTFVPTIANFEGTITGRYTYQSVSYAYEAVWRGVLQRQAPAYKDMDGHFTGSATVTKDEGGQTQGHLVLDLVCKQGGTDVMCIPPGTAYRWKGTYSDGRLTLKGTDNSTTSMELAGEVVASTPEFTTLKGTISGRYRSLFVVWYAFEGIWQGTVQH